MLVALLAAMALVVLWVALMEIGANRNRRCNLAFKRECDRLERGEITQEQLEQYMVENDHAPLGGPDARR